MSLLINNFAEGWVNKYQHTLMKDTQVYVATDVDFTETGAIKCRKKHSLHTPYFAGVSVATPINNIYKIEVEGVDKQLIYYTRSTGLFRWNSETNVTTTISTAITSVRHVSYTAIVPELSDYTYVYITDGITMLCDNGTTTKTWGIDPPESAVTVAAYSIVGELSAGEYAYSYTFYDDSTGTESDSSPVCAPITVAATASVLVSNIGVSTNARVTSRRLYRTIANGGTRYFVAIIPDNSTTTFVDVKSDDVLVDALVMDQGIPPLGDVVLAVKDTLFLTGNVDFKNRVYFCIPEHPDNFPSVYYIDVGNSGTIVQNMVESDGKVYFVTKDGVYGLSGTDADSYAALSTKAQGGTDARWSVVACGGAVYYKTRIGVNRFDGVSSVNILADIEKLSWETPTALYSVIDKEQSASKCIGTKFDSKYYLIVPLKNTSGVTSNKLLEYNHAEKQWRVIGTRLDDVFGDDDRGVLFGSADLDFVADVGTSMVYSLLSSDSGLATDQPTVDIVTKEYDISTVAEEPVKSPEVAYGMKAKRVTEIGWLREYRIDASGGGVVYLYVDGVLRVTATLTGLSRANANLWRNITPAIKGRYAYVRLTATNAGPSTHILRELELR